MNRYNSKPSKFNNFPVVEIKNAQFKIENGWEAICQRLNSEIGKMPGNKKVIVLETVVEIQ